MTVYRKNLHHAQKLQKQAHDKAMKSRSYVLNDKVLLNSKYIKPKQNYKLEAKFVGPFQVLYSVENQAYKLKLQKKQKIYDVFHMSVLENDNTKKDWMDETTSQFQFKVDDKGKEYKINEIQHSVVYTRELVEDDLLELNYLILQKGYFEEKNSQEPA